MSEPGSVLVTGASGFIAKHVILQLLEAGHRVTGSLRNAARADEVRAALRPHLPADTDLADKLQFVTLDLGSDEGWEAAMQGSDVLIHTASPFPLVQPSNEDVLIRPAVDGTLRALRAAHKAGITRVILTSSAVAVMNTDLPAGRTEYGEEDWTDLAHPTATAYVKSKTEAERAAWDFVRTEAPEIALTTINPGLVVGRPLDTNYGTSLQLVERILRGKDPMLPRIGFPVVDVSDVARMHVLAMETPETAGRRLIAAESFLWFTETAEILNAAFPARRIPTRQAPDFFIRMLGLFDKSVGTIVGSLGLRTDLDSTPARELLGIEFIPAADSLRSSAEFLIETGRV